MITVDTIIANLPGLCFRCARPIYVGDKIVIIKHSDKPIPNTTYHEECYKIEIGVKFKEGD